MPSVPFPITGTSNDDIRQQVYYLIQDLYENHIGGADLGDVFSLPGEVLTLVLATVSGLTKSGNVLSVQVTSDGGLQINANGVLIKLVSTGGLETTASGLGIKLDGSSLTLSAAGLKVTPTDKKYTVQNYNSDTLLTSADLEKIHIMDVSGGERAFWLPDVSATDIGDWLTIGRNGTGNLLRVWAGGTDVILNSNAGSYIECTDALHDYSMIELVVIADGQWIAKSYGIWSTY
jgi:hypothetical protein